MMSAMQISSSAKAVKIEYIVGLSHSVRPPLLVFLLYIMTVILSDLWQDMDQGDSQEYATWECISYTKYSMILSTEVDVVWQNSWYEC